MVHVRRVIPLTPNLCVDHINCRVIDGVDSTLDAVEKVPVDDKHRPIQEIRIKSVTIHANPIAEKAIAEKAT